jgi:hypothetical protein
MNDIGAQQYLDPMDVMGMVVAAIIHDMGHPGKSNVFHVNTSHSLAITYNDRSVLENFHSAEGFRLINSDPAANFLDGLTGKQCRVFREEVISMVLGTDMTHHFGAVGEFRTLTHKNGTEPGLWHAEEKSIDALRIMVLHTADLANPAKGVALALEWSERILAEMFSQGDEEKKLGLPVSPLADRLTTDIPNMQCGFIDFIVQPSMAALNELMPRVGDICQSNLRRTRDLWQAKSNRDKEAKESTGTT